MKLYLVFVPLLLLVLAAPGAANTVAVPGRPPDAQHGIWITRLTNARQAVEQARQTASASDK